MTVSIFMEKIVGLHKHSAMKLLLIRLKKNRIFIFNIISCNYNNFDFIKWLHCYEKYNLPFFGSRQMAVRDVRV